MGKHRWTAVGLCLAVLTLSTLATLAGGAPALGGWLLVDRLACLALIVSSGAGALTFTLAPLRDLSPARIALLLVTLIATWLTFVAGHPLVLVAGWTLSALPFIAGPFAAQTWRPRIALAASSAALAIGAGLMLGAAPGQNWLSLADIGPHDPGGAAAFACLMVAIVVRTGVFPAHAWMADAIDADPLPAALLVNGHLGAFILARVVVPHFPAAVNGSFVLLSDLALFTALYAAVRAIAEPRPRRVLSLIALSQAACILAALESATTEGTLGALLQLAVVVIATTGLFGVLRAAEVRYSGLDLARYHGLATALPRFAVGFVVCALALVGLPGTMGFPASELLLHGSLATHPQLGILLPLATALNAICLYRLFARVFLGRATPPAAGLGDALTRERLAIAAIVVVLVVGGIMPGWLVRGASVQELTGASSAGAGGHP